MQQISLSLLHIAPSTGAFQQNQDLLEKGYQTSSFASRCLGNLSRTFHLWLSFPPRRRP
jgi:hypothetical protein